MKNAKFEMNTKGRDFFVGDLHGMYDAFQKKLKRVDFDYDVDRVFSVGDLADRGPQSVDCLRLLEAPWFHAVRGNHEDFLLGSHDYSIWMMNGGEWSNAVDAEEFKELQELVREKMHRTMTIHTPLGTIGVVHAESADDWKHNSEITENINTWSRTRIKIKNAEPIKNISRVVVGHTVVKEPVLLGNILYIDTGAVFDRELTMLDTIEVFSNKYKRIVGQAPKTLTQEEEIIRAFF